MAAHVQKADHNIDCKGTKSKESCKVLADKSFWRHCKSRRPHYIHEHQTVAHGLELHPNFTLPTSHLIVHIIAIHVYSVGLFGASGLPFTVRVVVKLLLYGTFVYFLLSTFLDSRIILLIQYGQSAASVST